MNNFIRKHSSTIETIAVIALALIALFYWQNQSEKKDYDAELTDVLAHYSLKDILNEGEYDMYSILKTGCYDESEVSDAINQYYNLRDFAKSEGMIDPDIDSYQDYAKAYIDAGRDESSLLDEVLDYYDGVVFTKDYFDDIIGSAYYALGYNDRIVQKLGGNDLMNFYIMSSEDDLEDSFINYYNDGLDDADYDLTNN